MKKLCLLVALPMFAANAVLAQTQPGLTPPPNPLTDPTSGAASGAGGAGTFSPGVQTDTARQSSGASTVTASGGGNNGNPGVSATTPVSASGLAVMVDSGVTYLVRGTEKIRVDQTIAMTISPQGVITGFFGKPFSLPEGQMLTMDGRLSDIPIDLQLAPAAKPSASEVVQKNDAETGK